MTTQTRPKAKVTVAPEAPPYTWAGHTWTGASLLSPLVAWAVLGLTAAGTHFWLNAPWWSGTAGIVFLAAAVAAAHGERFAQSTILYTWGLGAYAFVWYGWASLDLAWRFPSAVDGGRQAAGGNTGWWTIGAYVFAMFLAFCLWPSVRRVQIRHESRIYARRLTIIPAQLVASPEQMAPVDDRDPRARQWERLYENNGKKGLQFVAEVENEAGVSVRLRLPVPGINPAVPAVKFSDIARDDFREQLEQAMGDLRPGAIRFERARNEKTGQVSSLDFWMHVDYADILAKIIQMPVDEMQGPISINDAFPIGRMADGTTLALTLREIHAMIVGATRMGKSNLLHVIIFQLTRCYDAATWMIDLKGGATAKPWLQAWKTGKTRRPILDWVAIDRWEAARILLACIDIATDRPLRRSGSKTEPQRAGMPMRTLDPKTGKRKIATIDRPAIILLTDELAELVGSHTGPTMTSQDDGLTSATLAKLVTRIATLATGEAVWATFAGQRNTADMFGNPSAQKNMGLKIAVGPMDKQDAGMVFGQSAPGAADMVNMLEHPGSVLVWKFGQTKTLPAKIFFAGDDDALDAFALNASIAHAEYPATVETDPYAKRRADEWGYEDRWTDTARCGWLWLDDNDPRIDDEGSVNGWESVPLPLDAQNQPLRASEHRQQQARVDAARQRATRQQQPPTPDMPTTAEMDAVRGGRGFWPAPDQQQPPAGTPSRPAPTAGPISTNPDDVDRMLDQFAELLNDDNAPAPPAPDEDDVPAGGATLYEKVLATAKIIDGYGRAGVPANELARDMIAHNIITARGQKAYRRFVLKAMEPGAVLDPDLRVVQPSGPGGRYFTHRHTIVSR